MKEEILTLNKIKYPNKKFQQMVRSSFHVQGPVGCITWSWERIEKEYSARCELMYYCYKTVFALIRDFQ